MHSTRMMAAKGKGYRVAYHGIPIPPKRGAKCSNRREIDEDFLRALKIGDSFWNYRGFGYYSTLALTLGIQLTERSMPNGKVMTWRVS